MVRVSLVEVDIPPLLSRAALKYLGAKIDLEKDRMKLASLGRKNVALNQVPSGHLAVDVMEYAPTGPKPPSLALYHVREGSEVALYAKRDSGLVHTPAAVHIVSYQATASQDLGVKAEVRDVQDARDGIGSQMEQPALELDNNIMHAGKGIVVQEVV